jgi:hypothetical protein
VRQAALVILILAAGFALLALWPSGVKEWEEPTSWKQVDPPPGRSSGYDTEWDTTSNQITIGVGPLPTDCSTGAIAYQPENDALYMCVDSALIELGP